MATRPHHKTPGPGWWEFDLEDQVGPSPPPPAYATFRRQTAPQPPAIPLLTLNHNGTTSVTPSAMEAQLDGASTAPEPQSTQPADAASTSTRRKPGLCTLLYLILSITALGLLYAHPHAPQSKSYAWSNPILGDDLNWRQVALASIDRPTLWAAFLVFFVFCGGMFEIVALWGPKAEVRGWRLRRVWVFGGLLGVLGGFLCAIIATL